ncbi:hypothetical protein [Accumulibacter sp.]|uniref:hypothetical protein n=1 Tax=Accumulibacter sp. TaxID=2053492 RepID=UPI002C89DB9A|nr:hypothetical protein [Accumulibacter sp.]HNC19638.1 hypothetical protein [Accumulibacter sp.]
MKLRILIAYSMESTFNQATLDYLNAFGDHLDGEVDFLHVTHDARVAVSLHRYDVVIQSYCARLCFADYVSAAFVDRLRAFGGLKVLAVQDEYNRTDVLKRAIRDIGFDVVLTCVPQDSLEYVYPRAEFPNVRFETVLTGYVSEAFAESRAGSVPLRERPIVVGYRGRDLGGLYGRLGFEKYEIGRRMKEICVQRSIPHDISMDPESRIYGSAWFDFIGSCRSMLGSESGSNVFDFDGSLERQFNELARVLGHQPGYADFLPLVAQRDSEISMGQISPRVFECALMRTPMILFRGRYSDAIEPDVHYIVLEKDFSNVEEVVDRLRHFDELEAMTTRTYDHLVHSGRFGYRAYMKRIAGIIEEEIERRSTDAGDGRPPEAAEACESDVPQWKRQTPTRRPQPASRFQLIRGKELFECYFNEVQRLEGLQGDTLARFRQACLDRAASLSGHADQSALGEFGRLLDDIEVQFRTLADERSGMSQLVADFANIGTLPEINRLVDTYERQAKLLMNSFDQMNSNWNRLVVELDASSNRTEVKESPTERVIRRSLRARLASIVNRILNRE